MVLSQQTFTKKRAPYFHVHIVLPYKVLVVQREVMIPDQYRNRDFVPALAYKQFRDELCLTS